MDILLAFRMRSIKQKKQTIKIISYISKLFSPEIDSLGYKQKTIFIRLCDVVYTAVVLRGKINLAYKLYS